MRRLFVFLATVSIVLSGSPLWAEVRYNVTDLTVLWRDAVELDCTITSFEGVALNDQGQIVGNYKLDSGIRHGFLWSAAAGLHDFGPKTLCKDVNNQGQVVGDKRGPAIEPTGFFLWDPVGGMRFLDDSLASPGWVASVNDVGCVVGACPTWEPFLYQAFVWEAEKNVQLLEPTGGLMSQACAVNNTGQVVGTEVGREGETSSFLWDKANGMQELGHVSVSDINDLGQIIGYESRSVPMNEDTFVTIHSVVLWEAGQWREFGTLGEDSVYPSAINNHTQVVGDTLPDPTSSRAFLCEEDEGIVDLNDLIHYTTPWTITSAVDINNNGWILAYEWDEDGTITPLLLTPVPEPSVGAMLFLLLGTLGFVGFALCRRSRAAGPRFFHLLEGKENTMRRLFVFLALVPIVLAGSTLRAEVRYNVTDLTALWRDAVELDWTITSFEGVALNDRGQIVGNYTTWQDDTLAFIWDPVEGLRDLGNLGRPITNAYAINNSGQVAGLSCPDYIAGGDGRAFLWDHEQGMQNLGTLGGPSYAIDINEQGVVVGASWPGDGFSHAFRWDAENGMQDLGTFGGEYASAHGINNQGQVVGFAETAEKTGRAFLWEQENGLCNLGSFGRGSLANDLNDRGQVVGYSAYQEDISHAFLWEGGSMMDIDTLGCARSAAEAINNLGQVVGRARVSVGLEVVGGEFAFLWDEANGMRDLNDLVAETAWNIVWARDISNNGCILAQARDSNKQTATLLLTPVPEPSVLGMLLVLFVAVVGRTVVSRYRCKCS